MIHPTIARLQEVVAHGDDSQIADLLAGDVQFLPPTYWKTWTGRAPVAAILGHVGEVFSDFRYRRIMGAADDWALEFQCKIGEFDAVGVDLITLNSDGQINQFEVVMRPYKSIGVLREAIMARVTSDPRFLQYQSALS
ncbi:nuclear transport factor 2 family protein [Phaeobacter sp. C3_T13_0]|uniref:nuclear transport factor 2 family protein n=1 Tax=Phaeobacter cretensis TaxID=3342641 RepID=UPI0039BCF881